MPDWLRIDSLLWWWQGITLRQRAVVVLCVGAMGLGVPLAWWQWTSPRVITIPDERSVSLAVNTPPSPDVSPSPASESSGAPSCTPVGPINLNNATVEQLDTLPGVGPVIAGRIVQWRNRHGRFTSVDELREVEGIGPVTWAKLAPLVRV